MGNNQKETGSLAPTVLRGTSSSSAGPAAGIPDMSNGSQNVAQQVARQAMEQQQARNIALQSDNTGTKANPTVTSAVANATKQAVNSNEQEYGTHARLEAVKRMQEAALFVPRHEYHQAYEDAQKFGSSMIDYSSRKGGFAALEQRGQSLLGTLNGNVQSLSTLKPMSYTQFTQNAGSIYRESMRDGKHIVLTHDVGNGKYIKEKTAASIDIKSSVADQGKSQRLIDDIGQFQADRAQQLYNIERLTTGAKANEGTLLAVDEIRTGNYKALDARLNLSERYNNHISSKERGLDRMKRPDTMIQDFRGTQKDIDKLRSAVDEHGQSIFTREELDELEECITASGISPESGGMMDMTIRGAANQARHRLATSWLDETQGAGANAVISGVRAGRAVSRLAGSVKSARHERAAEKVVKNVDRLLNSKEELLKGNMDARTRKKIGRMDKKLNRYGRQVGAAGKDAEAIRAAAKESQEIAREMRQARKELNRATSGMTRVQKKRALMEVRQKEMVLKHGQRSRKLDKKIDRLSAKLQAKNQRSRLIKGAAKKAGRTGAAAGKAAGAAGKTAGSAIGKAAGVAGKGIAGAGAAIVGVILVVIIGICALVALFIGMFSIFIEENTDTGKSDLQIVNEAMNDYESQQLEIMEGAIRSIVARDYNNGLKRYWTFGSNAGHVEVVSDYEIRDEYGNPASMCNCMQAMTLYRYYYLFKDGAKSDDLNSESFWTGNFRRKMEQVWDRTHYVTTRGLFNKAHTQTWNPSAIKMNDLIISGGLENGGIFCTDLTQCTNQFTYSTTQVIGDGSGGYTTITVYHTVCAGHVKAQAKVQVDTDIKTIASGNKLEGKFGKNIRYADFSEDELREIADFIGTYDDHYEIGYENYAEFEIYFGAAEGMLNPAQIREIMAKITKEYGELSELQTAVIFTALKGCGRFTYSQASHESGSRKGVTGGATDCSGYVSWVHNNCGMYPNSVCYSTEGWWNTRGAVDNPGLSRLAPGSVLIRIKGAADSVSHNGNHAVIWLGYLDGQPMIVECTSGGAGGSQYRSRNVGDYAMALPIGKTADW